MDKGGKTMEKVKFALTILSIAIIVVPLVVEVYAYINNPLSLVIPPQIQNLLSGQNHSNSGSNGIQLPNNSQSSSKSQSLPNFQTPQLAGPPQYNSATGAFSVPFNVTNPLTSQLSIQNFSAEVVGQNDVPLGNVSITPVNLAAGESTIITATGNLNPSSVNQLVSEYQSGNLNVSLENINLNMAGVTVHIDQISDIGQILTSAGEPNIPSSTG